jgi:hypothetical protein
MLAAASSCIICGAVISVGDRAVVVYKTTVDGRLSLREHTSDGDSIGTFLTFCEQCSPQYLQEIVDSLDPNGLSIAIHPKLVNATYARELGRDFIVKELGRILVELDDFREGKAKTYLDPENYIRRVKIEPSGSPNVTMGSRLRVTIWRRGGHEEIHEWFGSAGRLIKV